MERADFFSLSSLLQLLAKPTMTSNNASPSTPTAQRGTPTLTPFQAADRALLLACVAALEQPVATTEEEYRPLGNIAYDYSVKLGFNVSVFVAEKLRRCELTWKLPPVSQFTAGRKYERQLGFPISRDIEVRLHAADMRDSWLRRK